MSLDSLIMQSIPMDPKHSIIKKMHCNNKSHYKITPSYNFSQFVIHLNTHRCSTTRLAVYLVFLVSESADFPLSPLFDLNTQENKFTTQCRLVINERTRSCDIVNQKLHVFMHSYIGLNITRGPEGPEALT